MRPRPLQFDFNGELFKITFEYTTINKCRGVIALIDLRMPDGAWNTKTRGFAQCLPQDAFCKETGRLIALRRAAGKTSWLALEFPEGPRYGTWVSTFPVDWDRKQWAAAVWKCYMGR